MAKFVNSFATAAVTVATTATQIVSARTARQGLIVFNNGGADLTIGPDNTLTTSSGITVPSKQSISLDYYNGPVFGICASGTLDVRFGELF